MIYGSSYASSSSSRAGLGLESSGAEDIGNERRPLLQSYNQNFWTSRETERTSFGALDTAHLQPIPVAEAYNPDGKMVRLRKFIKKLETDHEPGVSNAQLMLINHDLKPGMTFHLYFFPLCCSAGVIVVFGFYLSDYRCMNVMRATSPFSRRMRWLAGMCG